MSKSDYEKFFDFKCWFLVILAIVLLLGVLKFSNNNIVKISTTTYIGYNCRINDALLKVLDAEIPHKYNGKEYHLICHVVYATPTKGVDFDILKARFPSEESLNKAICNVIYNTKEELFSNNHPSFIRESINTKTEFLYKVFENMKYTPLNKKICVDSIIVIEINKD